MAAMKHKEKEKLTEEDLKERENDNPKVKEIMDKLRKELFKRGATGIAGLGRKFRIVDDSGDGHLDATEFAKCMKEQKLGLEPREVRQIFKFFDEDDSGTITYDEFLFGIRGEMNARREQMVLLAFDVIDADKSGVMDIDDIADKYNAKTNPDVISGKKTEKQVLKEFLDNFDQGDKDGKVYPNEFKRYYANISASIDDDDYFELMIRNAWHIPGGEGWCANTANKRVLVVDPVTGVESIQCIENDLGMDASDPAQIAARLAMNKGKPGPGGAGAKTGVQKNTNPLNKFGASSISNTGYDKEKAAAEKEKAAKLGKPKVQSSLGKSTAAITGGNLEYGHKEEVLEEEAMGWSKDMPESTRTLMRRLKINLKRRGADGIAGLARKFRIVDDSGDGHLDLREFQKCMKEMQTGFEPAEVKEIFKYFDSDGSGTITYDEFLGGVRGELNTRRAQLVLLAFDILDADKGGFVDIDDIADKYNAKTNPDVMSGKKTEKQCLKEFLDTFDQGDKDGKVYPDEFCKYYSNVSASVDLDDYFELMIRNAWHIPGGEGWCANTANKRVLVTHPDGRQTVECIKNDLGLDLSDPKAIAASLRAQGVECGDDAVQTVGKLEDDKKPPAGPKVTKKPVAPANKKSAMNKTSLW